MKTLKILAVALFATGVAMAQDLKPADVPANLKDAFKKEFPKASDVEWERSMENYKVEFDLNRQDHDVWYNASGSIIKKEIEIAETELPQAIRESIKANFPEYRVDDVEMIWQNNLTTYQLEIEKGPTEKHLTFNSEGEVLNERND